MRSASLAGEKRYLRRQDGDRGAQHGGGGVHARAALEAERRFLVDGVAAAAQIVRAEIGPQHFLELLRSRCARNSLPLLSVDLGDLLQPGGAGDHLVDGAAKMRLEQRRDLLQDARAPDRRSCSSRAGRPTPGRRAAASSAATMVDQRLPRYTAAILVRALMTRSGSASQRPTPERRRLLPACGKPHRLSPGRPLGRPAAERWSRVVVAASGEERIRQLTQRMLRKKLYVILSKGGATAEQIGACCRSISNT